MGRRIDQAILRSEELRAERTLADLKGMQFKPNRTRSPNPNPNSKSFIGAGIGAGLLGGAVGLTLGRTSSTPKNLRSNPFNQGNVSRSSTTNPPQTSYNPNRNPNFATGGTLSAQVRKNQLKRKAHLKAQSLARHTEEESKIQMKQIADREARRAREAEESETKMNWTEPDGSKTILKFDEDGNLIGREVTKPKEDDLSAEELIKAREIARRKEEAEDGRLQRDKKGNALSKRKYRDSWATDPRTQSTQKIIKQVSGGL